MKTKTLTSPFRASYIYSILAMSAMLLFAFSGAFQAHAQTYSFSGNLGIGSTGSAVSELQRFLATDPTIYPQGLVTGYYGSLTAAAVQRFQCRQNIVCSGSAATTGYGRVGPMTFTRLISVGGLTGTGGPDMGDVHAPAISAAAVSVNSNSATLAWTSTEPSRSRVMYSKAFPFLYATAPSVADGVAFDGNLTQIVTIPNLAPNTTYFYVTESVDASGNVQLSTAKTFHTNQ